MAESLEEAQVRHRHKVTGPLHASEWQGTDSHYAFMKMEASETQLGTAQSDVTSIAAILDTVHVEMKSAQDQLRRSVRIAEADGFTVDDHGNVTDNSSCPTGNADEETQEGQAVRVAVMEGYQNEIQYGLDDASTADWKGMQLLQKIDAFTLDKDYGAQTAKDAAREVAGFSQLDEGAIPSKKDPKENAKWWASLSEQERQEYLDAYPEKIGWLVCYE
ncbi:hypothetical protein [Streptomyces sp. NRRL S-337]|uniref:hypothetical protein n=1 Tax=Streptomyces sp. NRRL S-337 TaxID=1463900 RepID=UPI00068A31AE|nr:hypothetical protein [Streptomyces sp. NRRL S-337]